MEYFQEARQCLWLTTARKLSVTSFREYLDQGLRIVEKLWNYYGMRSLIVPFYVHNRAEQNETNNAYFA